MHMYQCQQWPHAHGKHSNIGELFPRQQNPSITAIPPCSWAHNRSLPNICWQPNVRILALNSLDEATDYLSEVPLKLFCYFLEENQKHKSSLGSSCQLGVYFPLFQQHCLRAFSRSASLPRSCFNKQAVLMLAQCTQRMPRCNPSPQHWPTIAPLCQWQSCLQLYTSSYNFSFV